jgi:hypothetical protein
MRGGSKTREEDATREQQHFSLWLRSEIKPHFVSSQPQSGCSLATSVHRISPHEMLDAGQIIQEINSTFKPILANLIYKRPQNGITTDHEAAA